MPAYHVARSTTINAPAEQVFDTVADFGTWTTWSPWLGVDPNARVTVTDDPSSVGSQYSWVGELVGQGEIEHRKLDRPSLVVEELCFLKPFKSTSEVKFEIQPSGDHSTITWHMFGNLPWFLFWMKASMETFIGMDYQRGLNMLKELVETGRVLSKTEVVGVESIGPMEMLGVHDSCAMDEIGTSMDRAFETATSAFKANNLSTGGEMLSLYHRADLKERRFDYTGGYTVDTSLEPPSPLVRCHVPAGKALHIRHTGGYHHLGNAWSGGHQYARYKKLKLAKRDAIEIYRNNPEQTATEDLISDIYLPLR